MHLETEITEFDRLNAVGGRQLVHESESAHTIAQDAGGNPGLIVMQEVLNGERPREGKHTVVLFQFNFYCPM